MQKEVTEPSAEENVEREGETEPGETYDGTQRQVTEAAAEEDPQRDVDDVREEEVMINVHAPRDESPATAIWAVHEVLKQKLDQIIRNQNTAINLLQDIKTISVAPELPPRLPDGSLPPPWMVQYLHQQQALSKQKVRETTGKENQRAPLKAKTIQAPRRPHSDKRDDRPREDRPRDRCPRRKSPVRHRSPLRRSPVRQPRRSLPRRRSPAYR